MSNLLSISALEQTETNLIKINAECSQRIQVALNALCTEETKQSVKKLRAELNKEFAEYEAERKERTAEYEKPLRMFREMYDKYITQPFKNADLNLKRKISEVETIQKEEKEAEIKSYAEELKSLYVLDWLDIDRIMPNITLSASLKSLKAAVAEKLDKINSDVNCIDAIDNSGEMFAEYMKCLNLAQAKLTVVERQHAIEAAEKAKAAYSQNEEVNKQAEQKIEMLAPPKVEEEKPEEKKYTMTFTVTGTIQQLKAVKAFLIDNNIDFKNGGNNG